MSSAAASGKASAHSTGSICPPFTQSGLTLAADRVKTALGKVVLHDGPRGYHCFADFEKKGRAAGGVCYMNTLASPGYGFTWNGS